MNGCGSIEDGLGKGEEKVDRRTVACVDDVRNVTHE